MSDLLLSGGYYPASTIKRETLGRLIDTAVRTADRVTMDGEECAGRDETYNATGEEGVQCFFNGGE